MLPSSSWTGWMLAEPGNSIFAYWLSALPPASVLAVSAK
jgi:hypothetical protein